MRFSSVRYCAFGNAFDFLFDKNQTAATKKLLLNLVLEQNKQQHQLAISMEQFKNKEMELQHATKIKEIELQQAISMERFKNKGMELQQATKIKEMELQQKVLVNGFLSEVDRFLLQCLFRERGYDVEVQANQSVNEITKLV